MTFSSFENRIGGVMVNMLSMSAVDCGISPIGSKPKTIKLVFVSQH